MKPFDFLYKDGKWFWKANKIKPLVAKERDKPAFLAVYGIEEQAKNGMAESVSKAMKEIAQNLLK